MGGSEGSHSPRHCRDKRGPRGSPLEKIWRSAGLNGYVSMKRYTSEFLNALIWLLFSSLRTIKPFSDVFGCTLPLLSLKSLNLISEVSVRYCSTSPADIWPIAFIMSAGSFFLFTTQVNWWVLGKGSMLISPKIGLSSGQWWVKATKDAQPLINLYFCPDNLILALFSGSLASHPLSMNFWSISRCFDSVKAVFKFFKKANIIHWDNEMSASTGSQKLKLSDQVRQVLRIQHYSIHTV